MSSAAAKPLPDIPRIYVVARRNGRYRMELTPDARNHVRKVISQCVTEENLSASWVPVIHQTVEEIGSAVTNYDWFPGIQATRDFRRQHILETYSGSTDAIDPRDSKDKEKEKDVTIKSKQLSPAKMLGPPIKPYSRSPSPRRLRPPKLRGPELQELNSRAMAELRRLTNISNVMDLSSSPPTDAMLHLVVTLVMLDVSSSSSSPIPAPGCSFARGEYVIPQSEGEKTSHSEDAADVSGVESWKSLYRQCGRDDEGLSALRTMVIVGGKVVASGCFPTHKESLAKVFRLGLYTHISNILELSLLQSLGAEIVYPPPPKLTQETMTAIEEVAPPPSLPPPASPQLPNEGAKTRKSRFSGVWSFLTKRAFSTRESPERYDHQITNALSNGLRHMKREALPPPPTTKAETEDAISRLAIGVSNGPSDPFTAALNAIQAESSIFSTSHSVRFDPPDTLVRLANDEAWSSMADTSGTTGASRASDDRNLVTTTTTTTPRKRRRVTGADKAALSSILGWRPDGGGSGFGGTLGFLKHQCITLLYSSTARVENLMEAKLSAGRPISPHPGINATSATGTVSDRNGHIPSPYTHTSWISYRYYDEREPTLGQWLAEAGEEAETVTCQLTAAESVGPLEHTWMHLNLKLTARIEVHHTMNTEGIQAKTLDHDFEEITVLNSCIVCGKATPTRVLEPGAWLLDFGKFLELMFYSSQVNQLSPTLCEHTAPSLREAALPEQRNPEPRFCILHSFIRGSTTISFTTTPVQDVFEARIPRCQVTSSIAEVSRRDVWADDGEWLRCEKDRLRLDMTFAWKGLKDQLRWLEDLTLDDPNSSHKQLPDPPLFSESPEESLTRRPSAANTNASTGSSPHGTESPSSSLFTVGRSTTRTSGSVSSLASLKDLIASAETALYKRLGQSSLEDLGEIRRAFISNASDTYQRLQSNVPPGLERTLPDILPTLPEWWQPRTHCLPNCSVIVRESEWGSIIAFTLRSPEYRKELSEMASGSALSTNAGRSSSATSKPPPSYRPTTSMRRSFSGPISFSGASNGFAFKSYAEPVREVDDMMGREIEEFSAVISRKETPRDVTPLLSLREVLKHPRSFDTSSSPSRIGTPSTASRLTGLSVPKGAWSKPDVQVSMQNAGGEVTASAASSLPDLTTTAQTSSVKPANAPASSCGPSGISTQPYSTITANTLTSQPTISERPSTEASAEPSKRLGMDGPPPEYPTMFGSTFTGALRFMMSPNNLRRPHEPRTTYDETLHRLALLGLDHGSSLPRIDSRPHLQYDFTVGNRLRFSCTSYYALQFHHLRKQCGIEEAFMRSLERTTGWIAEGGKSKASFFKTADDRFILKTLVTAWHVSDLQVLLELSPSYFSYMSQTQDKPSALAKLLGFYTIEVQNIETGHIESKADVLVMENLFWNHKPDPIYDLKGIRGRKAKSDSVKKTMMDVDFIENQRRDPTYVAPRSKYVLQEALSSDAEFLASSNVMDYSLLLGVDQENHKVICGLVDTFGTYNFAKTIESKAKHRLKTGKEKEVTIVPPSEYQNRFLKAMDRYFISIPDKWSKSVVNHPSSSDYFRVTPIL